MDSGPGASLVMDLMSPPFKHSVLHRCTESAVGDQDMAVNE